MMLAAFFRSFLVGSYVPQPQPLLCLSGRSFSSGADLDFFPGHWLLFLLLVWEALRSSLIAPDFEAVKLPGLLRYCLNSFFFLPRFVPLRSRSPKSPKIHVHLSSFFPGTDDCHFLFFFSCITFAARIAFFFCINVFFPFIVFFAFWLPSVPTRTCSSSIFMSLP